MALRGQAFVVTGPGLHFNLHYHQKPAPTPLPRLRPEVRWKARNLKQGKKRRESKKKGKLVFKSPKMKLDWISFGFHVWGPSLGLCSSSISTHRVFLYPYTSKLSLSSFEWKAKARKTLWSCCSSWISEYEERYAKASEEEYRGVIKTSSLYSFSSKLKCNHAQNTSLISL